MRIFPCRSSGDKPSAFVGLRTQLFHHFWRINSLYVEFFVDSFFLFSILNISAHHHLVSMDSDEKSPYNLIEDSLSVANHFFLADSKILSFFFFFYILSFSLMVCLNAILSEFILTELFGLLACLYSYLSSIWGSFQPLFLKILFLLLLGLPWCTYWSG